jgi:hypothetical protein
VQVSMVRFGSAAERLGMEQGYVITMIEVPTGERPSKDWVYVPALALLALVMVLQRARMRRSAP